MSGVGASDSGAMRGQEVPQVAREFNIGSPTRLEMGQVTGPGITGAATATQAHEVPVPNTPRVNVGNGIMPNPFGFCQGGQQIPTGQFQQGCFGANVAGCGAPSLVGAQNLVGNTGSSMPFLGQPSDVYGNGCQGFVGQRPPGMMCPQGTQLGQGNVYGPVPSGICSGSRGSMPVGGLTPQAGQVNQILTLLDRLDAPQTRVLFETLGDRLVQQGRAVPEFFGSVPRGSGEPFLPDPNRDVLSGYAYEGYGGKGNSSFNLDAFSKSEKWLTPAPSPDVENWKNRDLEILGWAEFSNRLVAWAAQGSEEFANEISHATKWPSPIVWDQLSKFQKNRSTRLFSILKAAFSSHPRTSMIISAFSEGLNIHGNSGGFGVLTESEMKSNGYELLRQLTQEFSLRSRAEALNLRTSLASKSFSLSASETTVGTVVSDTIRKLDYECSRYTRLVNTLPSHVDSTGLVLPEADMLMILLRSLPPTVRDYCLHHSGGETFQAYKQTAKRWEEQQRLFQEVHGSGKVSQVFGGEQTEWYTLEETEEWNAQVNAVSAGKCGKCGSRKHRTEDCVTDLSKVRCFKCNSLGHIGANCSAKGSPGVQQSDRWNKGKNKGGKKGKDNKGSKSKGKGFGKKGKLNEVNEEEFDPSDSWWYEDWEWYQDDGWNTWMTAQVYDSWNGSDWQWQEEQSWKEPEKQPETEKSPTVSGTANSLMISMVFDSSEMFGEETGLFLGDNVCGDVSRGEFVTTKESEVGEVVTHGSISCPQPFDVFGNQSSFCKKVFCDCDVCMRVSKEFSEALRKASARDASVADGALGSSEGAWFAARVDGLQGTLPAADAGKRAGSGLKVVTGDRSLQANGHTHSSTFRFGLRGTFLDSGGNGSSSGKVLDGLLCDVPRKVSRFVLNMSTCLNCQSETCSPFSQLVKCFPIIHPLLSQLSLDDSSWWLLDSGASVTVLSERYASVYGVEGFKKTDQHGSHFRAANGTPVSMLGRAEVGVKICLMDEWGSNKTEKHAHLKAMIGSIQHNIISTTSLCDAGWDFWQSKSWFEVRNRSSGEVAAETGYFAGCPWVKLRPSGDRAVFSVLSEKDVEEFKETLGVAPLTRAAEAALRQHRLQGHTPYDPRCLECAKGKTTFQHRRRKENLLECELQADFAFISSRGELTDDEVDHCYKVLVLSELSSNCVGYVLVTHDLPSTRNNLVKWIDHMGMSSERSSIVLHTDSERAVSELVTKASDRFVFTVRRAAPQQHRSVGAAERAVRRLKESLAVVRADLNSASVDIAFSNESLGEVLTYLGLAHNHFGKSPDSDLSPLEFIAGRNLSKPVTALYGMNVLAEIPQSQRKGSPNESRNVEAMFLHHGLGSGAVVQAMIRHEGEMKLRKFVARNLKPVFPFSWDVAKSGGLLVNLAGVIEDRPPEQAIQDEPPVEPSIRQDTPDPGIIEYPDGAPPELVREMKESDDSLLVGSRKRPPSRVTFASDRPLTMRRQGPLVTSEVPRPNSESRESPDNNNLEFGKTDRCPACQSGMSGPGIRHSAACKRRYADFKKQRDVVVIESEGDSRVRTATSEGQVEDVGMPTVDQGGGPEGDMDVELPQDVPREDEYRGRLKRSAETSTSELEKEIKETSEEIVDSLLLTGMCWSDSGLPVLAEVGYDLGAPASFSFATGPEMFEESMSAIQFHGKEGHQSKSLELGGSVVLLWKPDEVIDDSTLGSLDPNLGFLGMEEELNNLNHCGTGRSLNEKQMSNLKQKYPNMRVITCRWVAAFKSPERVRCRIVAKDIKKGTTARSLGFSSPTPSIEGLHCMLTMSANRNFRLKSVDIAHAFMHSPMPEGEHVCLKLPLSVSFEDGTPVYLYLYRSLNGLRNASMHWLSLLSATIKSIGLRSDQVEPCIYAGQVWLDNETSGRAILMAYVDDVLIASETKEIEDLIVNSIGAVVPVKETGAIFPSDEGGGSLLFIGRRITRLPGHSCLTLHVDDKYLETAFKDFGITAGSQTVPDISVALERTLTDKQSGQKLTPEGYSRFRRTLGKLLWLAQSRHDLKVWLSIIGVQQSDPRHGTEMALKAVLRFLFCDRGVHLMLPSPSYEALEFPEMKRLNQFLHCFSDASFAPYRFNKRRGISGGIVMCEGGLCRSFARQQQSLSLSSCESELYAIQSVAQESVAFSRFCHRIMFAMSEIDEEEQVELILESDSASALQLIQSLDLPKRSRHVEIRLLWLQSQVESGKIVFRFRPGQQNVADLFTKCLPGKDFQRHRSTIGFIRMETSTEDLVMLSLNPSNNELVFVEICCSENSMLRKCCEDSKIPYLGVSRGVELRGVLGKVQKFISQHAQHESWIHIHISTPCSSGSPLRRFNNDTETDVDREWLPIMSSIPEYLDFSHGLRSASFELPRSNDIWSRDETKHVLEVGGLTHSQDVFLCQANYRGKNGLPVNKVLRFCATHPSFCTSLFRRFGQCNCPEHAALNQVTWTDTGYYNRVLARAILNAVKSCIRDEKKKQ